MIIDLHTHSTISDGSLTTVELVKKASEEGIKVLALCDHDTTGEQKSFLDNCKKYGIKGIVGIEVSGIYSGGNCHLLGYGVSDSNQELERLLQKIRNSRDKRNIKIVKNLNSIGIKISIDEISKIAGGDVIARPHIARVLVNSGVVKSVQEAFNLYLTKGKVGYVKRFNIEPTEAIKFLYNAGAKVVLAHPTQLKMSIDKLNLFVENLRNAGLWGIEVYTPYTPNELIQPYLEIAQRNHLKVTAGSDFHGASKPNHYLGELKNGKKIETSSLNGMISVEELI